MVNRNADIKLNQALSRRLKKKTKELSVIRDVIKNGYSEEENRLAIKGKLQELLNTDKCQSLKAFAVHVPPDINHLTCDDLDNHLISLTQYDLYFGKRNKTLFMQRTLPKSDMPIELEPMEFSVGSFVDWASSTFALGYYVTTINETLELTDGLEQLGLEKAKTILDDLTEEPVELAIIQYELNHDKNTAKESPVVKVKSTKKLFRKDGGYYVGDLFFAKAQQVQIYIGYNGYQ